MILYALTGKIKSVGEWSTAKWETYSAPEFKGYTPDKAQIDETTVNEDTQDTTVEISYTANETPRQETKDITRTIIVHEPNGTDQKVVQKATLTREVILYAPTGEIKSLGEWSTAKWGTYSAPEFKGYTPAP
ncbi:mucin-binding protein, partial [Lactobacillus johnsonii]|uniref:mucin-binding protein n=1 Tax=Lactobacillus johnsonii TaxID=33959 RepID=UPI003FEE9A8E